MDLFKLVVAVGLFAASYSVNAEVTPAEKQWVEQALSEINSNKDDANVLWQYSQQTVMVNMTRVEQFNGSLSETERWLLVSENGQIPDNERLKEYRQDQQDLNEDKDGNSHELAFSFSVDLSTLAFVGEDDVSVSFTFVPNIDELHNDALTGVLHLDKTSNHLRKILIKNTDELNPAFSVTLTKFELELSFDVFEGLVMPAHTSTTIMGTAAIFKSLDSVQTVTYSDYKILNNPQT
jgi:hypothetical protein